MTKSEFNNMWAELYSKIYSKIPGVTKSLSDQAAGITKKYLYPAGKVRIVSQNLLVDENSVTARMEIERYEGSSGTASVDFYTADGPIVPSADKKNAVKGVDYVESVGKVSWADGDTGTKFVDISIIDDVIYEDGEVRYLTFGIRNPVGVVLGNITKLELGIKDNEVKPINRGKVRINTTNMVVDENSSVIRIDIERFDGSDELVSVDFNTANGTAIAGIDYVASAGKLEWQDQETGIKSVNISIIDDNIYENNEVKNFDFKIMAPTDVILENSSITIGIRDNETTPPPPPQGRQLLGGWRVAQEFARGMIAIDWDNRKLYMGAHSQTNNINEYNLPEFGLGTDLNTWPRLDKIRTISPWWTGAGLNGLCWWRGKLWAITRLFYDMNPPTTLNLYAMDGETITINLPRQKFNGFVKRGVGLDPLIGCGGYESGQGSCSGPTLCTLDGQVLINNEWPSFPGTNADPLANWNKRAKRPANYWPVTGNDGWTAWVPRDANGVKSPIPVINPENYEGRWACDRVYGGGLVLPEGICFWVMLGIGDIDYNRQNETFAPTNKVYKYTYDKNTYELLSIEEDNSFNCVVGQEFDPQGRILLCDRNRWRSGAYTVDPVIKVYG